MRGMRKEMCRVSTIAVSAMCESLVSDADYTDVSLLHFFWWGLERSLCCRSAKLMLIMIAYNLIITPERRASPLIVVHWSARNKCWKLSVVGWRRNFTVRSFPCPREIWVYKFGHRWCNPLLTVNLSTGKNTETMLINGGARDIALLTNEEWTKVNRLPTSAWQWWSLLKLIMLTIRSVPESWFSVLIWKKHPGVDIKKRHLHSFCKEGRIISGRNCHECLKGLSREIDLAFDEKYS
jgi:hypothetical protein